jgi:hypothetical protein
MNVKQENKMNLLPNSIWSLIFEFDNSFKKIFKQTAFQNELTNKWFETPLTKQTCITKINNWHKENLENNGDFDFVNGYYSPIITLPYNPQDYIVLSIIEENIFKFKVMDINNLYDIFNFFEQEPTKRVYDGFISNTENIPQEKINQFMNFANLNYIFDQRSSSLPNLNNTNPHEFLYIYAHFDFYQLI